MKKLILGVFLLISTTMAFADTQLLGVVLNSAELASFEEKMSAQGFELLTISDTGARYRCPCWHFTLMFKNHDRTKTKTFAVGVTQIPSATGQGLEYNVSIGEEIKPKEKIRRNKT